MAGAGGQPDTLESLANSAGVSSYLVRYLTARGLVSIGAVALLASTAEEFSRTLIEPLATGWGSPDQFTIAADELPIAKATLLYLRELCIESRHRASAALATHAPAIAPSSASTAPASAPKAPTELAPGEWHKMITRYNKQQLGGRDRAFPEAELVGAEGIIAKALFEHEVSKQYTALPIGAILQARRFSSSGELNPLSRRRSETRVRVTAEGEFQTEQAEDCWDPRSMLSVMDGMRSIQWLWILIQLGDEVDILHFFSTLEKKLRGVPNKLPQFKVYYETVAWRLAQAMRANTSFQQASREILSDTILWQETIAKDAPSTASPSAEKKKRTAETETRGRRTKLNKPPPTPTDSSGRRADQARGQQSSTWKRGWDEPPAHDGKQQWYPNKTWRPDTASGAHKKKDE